MAYITLSELKSYLGTGEAGDDALLTAIITRAHGVIEARTGRKFEAATETRYFNSADIDGQDLPLYHDDLLTVTTLTNGDGVVIAGADFRLLPRNATPKWIIRLDEAKSWNFTDGDSEISVAGTWGYSATPPLDIVQACMRLSAFIYRQKDTGADIDRPIVTGEGVTIMPSGLPNDVMKLLEPYRRRL